MLNRRIFAAASVVASVVLATAFSAVPASAAPRKDVTIGVRLEPPHLDPTAGAAAAIGEIVYANVFEGLTRIDRNAAVKPALAEKWDVSADGKTYTFTLRKGATFHDGAPFNADAVKFTYDRARAADSVNPQKGLFEPIEAVEVVDPVDRQGHAEAPDRLVPVRTWAGPPP